MSGIRIGSLLMNIAALGAGIIIGFVYSWKLTLLVLVFMPMIAVAGVIEMKILQGTANSGKEALEEAGKVSCYGGVRRERGKQGMGMSAISVHCSVVG